MILIVDDEQDIREIYAMLLRDEGEIHQAEYGFAAWEKASKLKYELILCDYKMPHCDGLSFSKLLREKENPNMQTPILMVTSYLGDIEDDKLNIENLFFLRKPVETKNLFRMVRIVTEGRINPKGAA